MKPLVALAMARAVRRKIADTGLDLRGCVVATECANDAYAATAAAALAAGAEVHAFGRSSRYATFEQASADVLALVAALGADSSRLHLTDDAATIPWSRVDLVTNSGHLRPLDATRLGQLPDHAVIALMFEAWELRDGDIDVATAHQRGLAIVGVDEHHPACGSFELVGTLAVSEAMRQRWSLDGARVLVVSDNAFQAPVLRALRRAGADAVSCDPRGCVTTAGHVALEAAAVDDAFDLAIVATTPGKVAADGARGPTAPEQLAALLVRAGVYGAVQLWGDIDRAPAEAAGVSFGPANAPAPGHQAVPMNGAGFEATVRLQVGGLAAAAWALAARRGAEIPASLAGLLQVVPNPSPGGTP